jgi:nucleoside-diphosphate-sugar epimerase
MPGIDLLEGDAGREISGVPFASLEDKTILVTGASGVIGTHLLYGLRRFRRDHGVNVRATGVVRGERPGHLAPLERDGTAAFLRGNLADSRFLADVPPADFIVHGATYGQPARFLAEAVATLKLNTTATIALLEKLRPGGRFLFLSSSEVYSGLKAPPFGEDAIGSSGPAHPRSSYIESKRCGEAVCEAFRASGIEALSARLCLAYGPGFRSGDQRVLYAFIERGLREGVIELLDSGEAQRTYCYVADAAYMLWRVLLEGKASVYNVGGVSSTTIAGLARLVGEALGVPVRIRDSGGTGLAGAPSDARLDITRFESQFGPVRFTELPEGIARTIAWQRSLGARS